MPFSCERSVLGDCNELLSYKDSILNALKRILIYFKHLELAYRSGLFAPSQMMSGFSDKIQAYICLTLDTLHERCCSGLRIQRAARKNLKRNICIRCAFRRN